MYIFQWKNIIKKMIKFTKYITSNSWAWSPEGNPHTFIRIFFNILTIGINKKGVTVMDSVKIKR